MTKSIFRIAGVAGSLLLAAATSHAQSLPTGLQTYQIIGDEGHVWAMLEDVARGEGATSFTDGMESIVSVTASSDGQILRYDHWEDGFEADPDAPAQATTLVLGDGNPANGDARDWSSDARLTADVILQGTHVALASRATSGPSLAQYVPIPRVATDVRFDGGDRLLATGGPVSVVHAQQPLNNPFVSGATEMFSREALDGAFTYSVPVGVDTYVRYGGNNTAGDPFKYVYVDIVAFDDGVQVSVDNGGGGTAAFTLDRGEHWSSKGAIGAAPGPPVTILEGTTLRTSGPVCAMLFTAGPGTYATRLYALLPDRMHDTDFIASAPGDDPAVQGSRPMNLYVFNPHAADITVTATDSLGTGSFTVPARGTRAYSEAAGMNRALPAGSTARLTSSSTFWVVNAADYQGTAVDWGDALIGARFLSAYYPVGWAPGTGDPAASFAARGSQGCNGSTPCDSLNRAPVFVAAVQDATLVTVDLDGDGVADEIDTNSDDVPDAAPLPGNTYRIDALEVLRVFDPYDYDNAGTQIRANKPVSATYAQDADQGTGSDATLDLGYAILPYDQRFLQPVLLLDKTGSRTSVPSAGGTVTFTLTLTAGDFGPITGLSFADLLPSGMTYAVGSATVRHADGSTSAAEPAVAGQQLTWDLPADVLMHGQSITITYGASLPAGAAAGSYTNQASATGLLGSSTFAPTASFTLIKSDVVLAKTVDRATARVGDVLTYTITATNNGTQRERNVVISDAVPAGTTYVAGSASNAGTHDPAQNAVSWAIGNLNAGATVTRTFQVVVDSGSLEGDVIENVAGLDGNTVAGLRSLAARTMVVAPVLTGTKSGPASVLQGGRLAYVVAVANTGSADAASVVLRDPLPAGLVPVAGSLALSLDGAAFVSLTDAAGDDEGEITGTEVVLRLASLAAGGTASLRFEADADPGLAPPASLSNQASFASAEVRESTSNLVVTSLEADADGDGVPDGGDNCPTTPNPAQADADGDGLGDACDPCPRDAANDADGDGACEGTDNCAGLANPGQEDADADGAGDACDPCPLDPADDADGDGFCADADNCDVTPNPGQEDVDADGLGDACDACPSSPGGDTDGDGTCDETDNCDAVVNPGQEDADGDGLGDACDPCPLDPANDADGDGACEGTDNCAGLANPGQEDADADGSGDACDPCPLDPADDADGDGLCADADNCDVTPNPGQADVDADGLGDACDACPSSPGGDTDGDGTCDATDNCDAVVNPGQEDGDGDGLGDACDPCPLDPANDADGDGLCADADNCDVVANPGQEDFDGDGLGDACECASVPPLPADGIGWTLRPVDKTTFAWTAVPGAARYLVQRGTVPHLRGLGSRPAVYDHACFGIEAGTSFTDLDMPPGRDVFYYLVAPANDCSVPAATLGRDSDGKVRPDPGCL